MVRYSSENGTALRRLSKAWAGMRENPVSAYQGASVWDTRSWRYFRLPAPYPQCPYVVPHYQAGALNQQTRYLAMSLPWVS